jgi:hypothetical protein
MTVKMNVAFNVETEDFNITFEDEKGTILDNKEIKSTKFGANNRGTSIEVPWIVGDRIIEWYEPI